MAERRRHSGNNRSLTLLVAWLIILVAGGVSFRPVAAQVFQPETFILENGMRAVVIANHRLPAVTHMVWYKVGAADEPLGRSGLAHFLEHMMFKGTELYPGEQFSREVSRVGGQQNAFTGHDFTAYFQTVPKDQLERMMTLEANRMSDLVIGAEDLASEKQVILEERRQRVDNSPSAILGEQADAVLYLNSNYRRPVIGWEHEIRGLTREDLLAFYRAWYVPGNAILVVAGDVTAEEVRALADATYGQLPARQLPERLALQEPPAPTSRRVILRDQRVEQPSWSRSYLAPSLLDGAREHAYPLQILAEIIGGGTTSRLYQSLVVEGAQAVSAGAGYNPLRRGPSRFMVFVTPREGVPLDTIEGAAERVIDAVRAGGVTKDEMERAKTRLRAETIYARDSLSAGAFHFGQALSLGLGIEDVEAWPEAIARVTADEVVAAARAVLNDGGAVTALLLADRSFEGAAALTSEADQ